jgi:hypothetical protein
MDTTTPATPPVIQINAGLTRSDLAAIAMMVSGAVTALLAGGYLFLPAKQTDMTAVQGVVAELRAQVNDTRDTLGKLVTALDGLHVAVDGLNATMKPSAAPRTPQPTGRSRP